MPGALLHAASFHLPPMLLAATYGSQVAGWFSLQERVLAVPLSFLASAVAQAFYSEAARFAREDPTKLLALFRATLRNMFFIGAIPIISLGVFGPSLFSFVFGLEWAPAGEYARILCIVTLLRFCVGPVFYVLSILNLQKLQAIADFAGLAILLIGFWAAVAYGWDDRMAVGMYGIATLLTYLALLGLSWKAVARHHARQTAKAIAILPKCAT